MPFQRLTLGKPQGQHEKGSRPANPCVGARETQALGKTPFLRVKTREKRHFSKPEVSEHKPEPGLRAYYPSYAGLYIMRRVGFRVAKLTRIKQYSTMQVSPVFCRIMTKSGVLKGWSV